MPCHDFYDAITKGAELATDKVVAGAQHNVD
jgi:hypothetical protein